MIPIRNVYYMLAYAFQVLQEKGYKRTGEESFDNIADLMAAILARGISMQVKRGLSKDYISQVEITSSLRGKIDMTASIKGNTLRQKKLVCCFDEFSANERKNQIIKSTVQLLLQADISSARKKELQKLMSYFAAVDMVDLHQVHWHMRYNRNNQTYQMLIAICELVVKGLLQTTVDGKTKLMDFLDEQRMCRLYEKFILAYYKKEWPALSVNASEIKWQLDEGDPFLLPNMRSDITLQKGNRVLIIDAKYYAHTMQQRYEKRTVHSHNLYQIFTYGKNKAYGFPDGSHQVAGMLLYAKTDEELQPNQTYQMHGNTISVRILDLNLPFEEIAGQLDNIVKDYSGIERRLAK